MYMYVCMYLGMSYHLRYRRSSSPCVFLVFAFSFLDLAVAAARLLSAIPVCMYVCMYVCYVM